MLAGSADRRYTEGEQKANPAVANRPDFTDQVLSSEQLAEVRRNFARLSVPSLQTAYTEALERCKLDRRGRPPASIHVQVLVQAWRMLRKVKL